MENEHDNDNPKALYRCPRVYDFRYPFGDAEMGVPGLDLTKSSDRIPAPDNDNLPTDGPSYLSQQDCMYCMDSQEDVRKTCPNHHSDWFSSFGITHLGGVSRDLPLPQVTAPPSSELGPTEQAVGFCGTMNNPRITATEFVQKMMTKPHCIWAVAGREYAPTTGTPHLQWSAWFEKKVRWKSLSLFVDKERPCHVLRCKGQPSQNRAYCLKEHKFCALESFCCCEEGIIPVDVSPGVGKKKKLALAIEELKKPGTRFRDLDPSTYVVFGSGLSRLVALWKPPPQPEGVHISLWFGAAATGKTTCLYKTFPYEDLYIKPKIGSFFEGYDNQPVVVLDDFQGRASEMRLDQVLELCDQWPFYVSVKHSGTWLRPKRVIILSNIHPRLWYDFTRRERLYDALTSRIGSHVRVFNEDYSSAELDESQAKTFFGRLELNGTSSNYIDPEPNPLVSRTRPNTSWDKDFI
nr:MAG TPA: Rep protein [Cressdnaviricota sp.]